MMNMDPGCWGKKKICVTGGTGFFGWHLVQHLLPLAAQVRVFGLKPASSVLQSKLQPLECIYGDIRDEGAVRRALDQCDIVFHAAGNVATWGPGLRVMREIHVQGTQQVLRALPGHARMVHTSSVVAIGATRGCQPLTEESQFEIGHLRVDYVHAKRAAEEVALQASSSRDVVVVNPAYMIGPEDYEGSAMGKLCLRSWRGRVPLIPPGGLNFVDVRDVALGHLLAAQHGLSGRRYILGNVNLTVADFVRRLAELRQLSSRWWLRMPGWLYSLVGCGAEVRAYFRNREPFPSMQSVRVSRQNWYYSWQRAKDELGYQPRDLARTLEDTHAWYCQTGQLTPRAGTVPADSARKAA